MQAAASDFQWKEKLSANAIGVGAIFDVQVPKFLTARRIYHLMQANVSGAGAYRVYAAMVLMNGGVPKGEFPIEFGDFTGSQPNQSLICCLGSGGSPIGDSLQLQLAQPFNATTQVLMQPLRLTAEIDRIRFVIKAVSGVDTGVLLGFRAWLGCISTTPYN